MPSLDLICICNSAEKGFAVQFSIQFETKINVFAYRCLNVSQKLIPMGVISLCNRMVVNTSLVRHSRKEVGPNTWWYRGFTIHAILTTADHT